MNSDELAERQTYLRCELAHWEESDFPSLLTISRQLTFRQKFRQHVCAVLLVVTLYSGVFLSAGER